MAEDASPQLTGIVIITLPPPDKPFLGKTITAYTLSDHQPSTSQPTHQIDESQPHDPAHQSSSSFTAVLLKTPTTLLPILGLSLVALYVWISISRESFFQLPDDFQNDNDQKNKSQHTFIFPLYQKPYRVNSELGDVELKLGKLVGAMEFDDSMSGGKIKPKLVSTASKIDAASVIPVGGNVYPDGYVSSLNFVDWCLMLVLK